MHEPNSVLQSSKNYIGMVLKKNVLHGVYKLNGVEYEMKSGYITKSDPEPAKFDKVDLHRWTNAAVLCRRVWMHIYAITLILTLFNLTLNSRFRIYQDAQIVLTKDITSSTPKQPMPVSNQGEESKNLLDLSPSDVVFYVGGYPANFTVSDN